MYKTRCCIFLSTQTYQVANKGNVINIRPLSGRKNDVCLAEKQSHVTKSSEKREQDEEGMSNVGGRQRQSSLIHHRSWPLPASHIMPSTF